MNLELLQEGYLIKGTTDLEEARIFLGSKHFKNVKTLESGYYRKVPGQWSKYRLYKSDTPGAGAFPAVVAYL